MEKNVASKILKIAKLLYKDNNPFVSKYSWSSDYEFDLPKPILSIYSDEDFLRALFVENKNSFDEWSTMDESKIIIPVLKTYDIVTRFSGSEAVARTYSDRVNAYSEDDLVSRLNNCEPCYDEGEEVNVEWYDREGDWEVESIEQITEEDINRLVGKVLKEVSDDDISPSDNKDLCDELTIDDLTELKSKMRGMKISKKDMKRVNDIINKMNKETDELSSDLDVANTNLRLIQNIICTYSKEDRYNIDEKDINRIVKKVLR